MRILVDQDGVLADFERNFTEIWKKKYPNRIHVPMEQRTTFNIKDDYPKKYQKDIESIYNSPSFISSLPPILGGIEAVLEMDKMGLEVFICTSPLSEYKNCVLEKYEWVEKHLGKEWIKKIILSKDKTVIRGDKLIDDKPEINGIMTPSWEHIVFDQNYNKQILDKKRIIKWENWKEILEI